MTRPVKNLTINDQLRREIALRIMTIIEKSFFGEGGGNIRMICIGQNVELATTALLGRTIKSDRVQIYCEKYAAAHIRAVARVGEAVGIIAAQSLNQPLVQAILKSQHRTGNKESAGANSLIALNKLTVGTNQRTMKVHLHTPDTRNRAMEGSEILQFLTRRFEEVKLEDVLSSTFGDSKYEPIVENRGWTDARACLDHSQNPLFVYINHRFMGPDEVVYRFHIDPSKLDDAGLTQLTIYDTLLTVKEVMVIIHPASTFTFDLVPGNKPLTSFLTMIKNLMSASLKGIPGLISVSERKVQVSQLVRQEYYDQEEDKTYLYLNPIAMAHFPIEQLKARIRGNLIEEVTRLYHKPKKDPESSSLELFHLTYKGRPIIEQRAYSYFLFTGSLTMEELLSYPISEGEIFASLCDKRYLMSNDPNEMINLIGRTGARIIHEYNYSEELMAGETPLLYQHITTVCRRMFGLQLNPITAGSYMKNKEPNALDKFGYQNYRQNLEKEIIKGTLGRTDNLPSAVIVGKKTKLGTGYIEIVVDNVRRQEVIGLYSEARREQLYLNRYPGIHFPKLGQVKPMTTLPARPFGPNSGLPVKDFFGD